MCPCPKLWEDENNNNFIYTISTLFYEHVLTQQMQLHNFCQNSSPCYTFLLGDSIQNSLLHLYYVFNEQSTFFCKKEHCFHPNFWMYTAKIFINEKCMQTIGIVFMFSKGHKTGSQFHNLCSTFQMSIHIAKTMWLHWSQMVWICALGFLQATFIFLLWLHIENRCNTKLLIKLIASLCVCK